MTTEPFASPAWLLVGLFGNRAGWLALGGGRLRFEAEGASGFDVPLARVERIHFPWYYFGGGAHLWVDGCRFRLSFVRPNGAEVAIGRGLEAVAPGAGLAMAAGKLHDVATGREAGRRWRALLDRNGAS